MNKLIQKYMNWYYKNSSAIKSMCIASVIIDSIILLLLIYGGQFKIAYIMMWLWGLGIADLVYEYKRS
jgi:hypothetical protein